MNTTTDELLRQAILSYKPDPKIADRILQKIQKQRSRPECICVSVDFEKIFTSVFSESPFNTEGNAAKIFMPLQRYFARRRH